MSIGAKNGTALLVENARDSKRSLEEQHSAFTTLIEQSQHRAFALALSRLRDVEELVDTPELRNAIAEAREQARLLRRDYRQEQKKPDWTVVELKIVKPLVEVRNRVAEELARRDSKDSLAPIDRDPVPNRFAESVRRFYEELGKYK